MLADANIALVVCTGVRVVAVHGRTRETLSPKTLVVLRARVTVVADERRTRHSRLVGTSTRRIARIHGARVAVVAENLPDSRSHTRAVLALVALRAHVSVVAGDRVGRASARAALADVARARVAVVARRLVVGVRATLDLVARIVRAGVGVVARGVVRRVLATRCRVARVGRAGDAVVAVGRKASRADAVFARVLHGARVAVVAGGCVGCAHAPRLSGS